MQNISTFIEDFGSELNRQCSAFDGTWVKRMRVLNSKVMFTSIVAMLADRCSTFKSLSSVLAFDENLSNLKFSASSFCEARKRFPPYLFVDLSQWLYSYVDSKLSRGKWFGRSIFAIDSTTLTLPRELRAEGFGPEESIAFYPHTTLTVLYDLRLGLVYDSIISQHKSERLNAVQLFRGTPDGSLVIGDRGFFSFDLIQEAVLNKTDVLFRIALEHAPEEIQELRETSFKDIVITVTPSIPTEKKLLKNGYPVGPVEVRVLRKRICGKDYFLITTILDKAIGREDFYRLYQSRWDIEEYFKLIKSELQLESFKSKHLNGILQEIFAILFLTNLSEGVARLHLGPKTKTVDRKVASVLEIVRLIRVSFLEIISASKKRIRQVAEALERGIDRACSPCRPGRSYPRVFWKEINPWTKYAKGIRR